jgi:peptidoglycan/LPS O-acetylase OafA/YrhL
MQEPISERELQARVPSLDGLRAVSISCVLIAHVFFVYSESHRALWLRLVTNLGPLGVSIFFAISGFIITTLLVREREQAGRVDLGAFYIRRAFRIIPPFWVFLAAVLVAGSTVTLAHAATAAAFLSDYLPTDWWIGHTWSLSVEEQFYLLWPITFVIAGKGSLRVVLWLMALAPVVRIATHLAYPTIALDFMFHTRFDALMIGCAIALARRNREDALVLRLLKDGRVAAVSVAFLAVGSPLLVDRFHGAYQFPLGMSLDVLAVGSILVWSIQNPGTLPGRLLNSRPARHLGLISYSLYLWQQPFISPEMSGKVLGQFPLNCLLPLLLAEASYRFVEAPARQMRDHVLRWYWGRRQPERVSAS